MRWLTVALAMLAVSAQARDDELLEYGIGIGNYVRSEQGGQRSAPPLSYGYSAMPPYAPAGSGYQMQPRIYGPLYGVGPDGRPLRVIPPSMRRWSDRY